MSFPEYTTADITAGSLNAGQLDEEIRAEQAWTTEYLGITSIGTAFVVLFDGAPSEPEQLTIDGLVSDHVAAHPRQVPMLVSLLSNTYSVATADLEDVASVLMNWGCWVDPTSDYVMHLAGAYKATGGSVDVQVVEREADASDPITVVSATLPSTGGVWTQFVLTSGLGAFRPHKPWEYLVQVDKELLAAVEFRSMSLSACILG